MSDHSDIQIKKPSGMSLKCLRCNCEGIIQPNHTIIDSCSCLCCHYKDSKCVYCSVDCCIDCNGKYILKGDENNGYYFGCCNGCSFQKKSLLSDRFETMSNKLINTPTRPTYRTLLHSSVLACDPDLTWDLLMRGANPFVQDKMNITPIDLARLLYYSKLGQKSNEKSVYEILPKISFPDVERDGPVELRKLRTTSDLGVVKSPPHPKRQQGYIAESPPQMSLVLNACEATDLPPAPPSPVSSPVSGSPSGGGIYYPPASSPTLQRRKRSSTMTERQLVLETVSETAPTLLPPHPPLENTFNSSLTISSVPTTFPKGANYSLLSPEPFDRSHVQRAQTMTDCERCIFSPPHPSRARSSDPVIHRDRAMTMTEATVTLTGTRARQPLLRGYVSAGRRHAAAHAPALRKGKQVFTPLTLVKLSSGNDCSVSELSGNIPNALSSSCTEDSVHGLAQQMGVIYENEIDDDKEGYTRTSDRLKWEVLQLMESIAREVEVEGTGSKSASEETSSCDGNSGSDDTDKNEVENKRIRDISESVLGSDRDDSGPSDADIKRLASAAAAAFGLPSRRDTPPCDAQSTSDSDDIYMTCTACMDCLPHSKMVYSCSRMGCLSHLCEECMFRLSFVTITSALYAVPAIRCPGRCMGRIPTRVWRGALRGVKVCDDDRAAVKVKDKSMSLLDLLDLLFETFELFCVDYENDTVNNSLRVTHTCNLLYRIDAIAQHDDFSIEDLYCSAEEAGLVPEDSNVAYRSFHEFSQAVYPDKEVDDEDVSDNFLTMEDMLNDEDIEDTDAESRGVRRVRLCSFLAEVAVIVRSRMDTRLILPVSPENALLDDAEGLLMKRYVSNAEALLTMRCGECEETVNLFHSSINGSTIICNRDDRATNLKELVENLTDSQAVAFLRVWANFSNGRAPASAFVSNVIEAFILTRKFNSDEEKEEVISTIRNSAEDGIIRKDVLRYFNRVLSLLVDVERRFAAQLELYRRYPKIRVPCCNSKHCFLCKVEGHHKGKTCTEVQSAAMGTECQYCPGCGVATLRTEGCNEILCVCGTNWEWAGAIEDDDGGNESMRGGAKDNNEGEENGPHIDMIIDEEGPSRRSLSLDDSSVGLQFECEIGA